MVAICIETIVKFVKPKENKVKLSDIPSSKELAKKVLCFKPANEKEHDQLMEQLELVGWKTVLGTNPTTMRFNKNYSYVILGHVPFFRADGKPGSHLSLVDFVSDVGMEVTELEF